MNLENKPRASEKDINDAYAFVADLEARLIPMSSMNNEQRALWHGDEVRDGILREAYTTIDMGEDISAIEVMAAKFRNIPLEERRIPEFSIRENGLGHVAVMEEAALAA